jgi:hypothetical protein
MQRRPALVLFALGILLAPMLFAQTLRGPVIQVSSTPGGAPPQVAVAANGDFVVTWQAGFEYEGPIPKVWYRLYRADGTAKGKAQRVSGSAAGELGPAIALGEDGRFVIVWTGGNSEDTSAFGRRFDAQGRPLGGRFRLGTITDGSQFEPTVAMAADGGFLAAWTSAKFPFHSRTSDVYVRRFDAAGKPLGPEILASVNTFHEQSGSQAVMTENGDFLIGWVSFGGEPTFYDVFVRRFTSNGVPLGEEFEASLSPNPGVSQYDFALAVGSGGSFVVVWTDDAADPIPDDPSLSDPVGVLGQRYTADGTPAGEPFHVNAATEGFQSSPAVTLSPRGDFFVTWSSVTPGSPPQSDLLGRRFGSNGRPLSREIVLDDDGGTAGLAMAPTGRGVVAWTSRDGIFVRRLVAPAGP